MIEGKKLYGIDIECDDPDLLDRGASWVYGRGEILCVSVFNYQTGKNTFIEGVGNKKSLVRLMQNENAVLVGHNIVYDIGWLEYELGIQGGTKAILLDTMIAEGMLDEYGRKDLDTIAKKRLGIGKTKHAIEDYVRDVLGKSGDFRKYLKDVPIPLLKDYVKGDTEVTIKLFLVQYEEMKKQDLLKPFYIDCALIKIVLKMKRVGLRIDVKKKKENYGILKPVYDKLVSSFHKKYGTINLNSSKQKGVLFDKLNIDYEYKITLRGRHGQRYAKSQARKLLEEVKPFITGFGIQKKEATLFIGKRRRRPIEEVLEENGFIFSSNPSVGNKAILHLAETHQVVADILEIQQINGTLTKFLGEKFDRFIVNGRIYCDFNIAKSDDYGTITGRFSASNPNLQQMQAKGEVTIDGKTYDLAEMCRELFLPEKDCWLLSIDYSQIEFRLLVHYARGVGSDKAREMYNKDPNTDYHEFVRTISGLERKPAKNCNFGIMYGMGEKTMAKNFGWTKSATELVLEKYHTALPYVLTTLRRVMEVVQKRGYIKTIGGRKARLRDKNLAYTFLNRLNQGSSADIMKSAMVASNEEGIFDILDLHLTIHDELICSVPKTVEGVRAVIALRQILENNITLKVPIVAKPEIGGDWYHVEVAEEVEEFKRLSELGE